MTSSKSPEFYKKLSWIRFSLLCLIVALTLYLAYIVFISMPRYTKLQEQQLQQQQNLQKV